ncbi:MAG: CCA-adding enzyme [Candidatus Omnitrophica bacterium]|nr:CCA-adding enzyme [Candidatus Omnitrophota bacterium]
MSFPAGRSKRSGGEVPFMNKRTQALSIVRRLRAAGHEAYFVGGCVRDLLRGERPKDYDIATDAVPSRVAELFERTVGVGEQFGVMLVLVDGVPYEVATFRADVGYKDGRHPDSVRFTDAREDALRRDFTVNGLFYDPVSRKVLDWVGGRKDLDRRLIRAIGQPARRFEEDKLRMLRAVRFASVLGYTIEPRTASAIRKRASAIRQVSQERVRDELVKMFTGPHPGRALLLLDRTGLLEQVLPEVSAMKGVGQPRKYHPEGDVFRHTRLLMDQLSSPDPVLAFGCLLHDVGKPRTYERKDRIRFNGHEQVGARMAEEILTRLRFSNDHKRDIVACVEGHMRFKDVRQMRESTLKRFMRRQTFVTELEQHRVDCLASHGDLGNWRFLKRKQRSFGAEDLRPAPLVNGRDLMAEGYPEGPALGQALRRIEELQLEGHLKNRQEALEWARANKNRTGGEHGQSDR